MCDGLRNGLGISPSGSFKRFSKLLMGPLGDRYAWGYEATVGGCGKLRVNTHHQKFRKFDPAHKSRVATSECVSQSFRCSNSLRVASFCYELVIRFPAATITPACNLIRRSERHFILDGLQEGRYIFRYWPLGESSVAARKQS